MRERMLFGKSHVAGFIDRPHSPFRCSATHQVAARKFVFGRGQKEQSRQVPISIFSPRELDNLSDHISALARLPDEVAESFASTRERVHSVRRERPRRIRRNRTEL